MSIKIVLADDHKIIRQGLRSLLEKETDMEVIAEADNGQKAVRLARTLSPDVVIIDVAMPDLNGIEAARQIIAEVDRIKVIALSMHSDRRFVAEMLKVGVSGYLLKDCAFEELSGAIRAVAANKTYLSPGIAGIVVDDYIRYLPRTQHSSSHLLTAKEREVLQLLTEGKTTKEVAFNLEVSVKTVETHRQQIMKKLGLHSIAQLTKYAIREGLTSLE